MAIESFEGEWKVIKKNFEKATDKKKPSDKFLGVFNKASGITPASSKLDKAIKAADKGDAEKALDGFTKTCKAYQQTLAKAAAGEKDRNVNTEIKVMVGEIGNMMSEADKVVADIGVPKRVGNVNQWAKQMKDKAIGPRIIEFAKRTYNNDLLLFLGTMAKKDYSVRTYDTFIKTGGKYEMNLDSKLRNQFDPNDLGDAPWGKATEVAIGYFNTNIVDKLH